MAAAVQHQDRAHSVLGASSAYRWMACPGSVRASEGLPNRGSKYADEGTAAHQLCEKCLAACDNAMDHLGEIEKVNGDDWPVTEEMAEAVQVYLDTVRGAVQPGDTLRVEQQFDLSSVHEGMYGTNDACVLSPGRHTLFVFDYKHGRGHAVEVERNPQLTYYGIGALLGLAPDEAVREIELVVVQPRAPHRDGPVRRFRMTIMDIMDFTHDLAEAAERTRQPDAPRVAGEHCRFCLAAPTCPALRQQSLKTAEIDFADLVQPRDPTSLTPDQRARVLDAADMVDAWIAAVRAHALHEAERGVETPGYKLVPKRATRRWNAAEETILAAIPRETLFEPKMRTPAQVEKDLPKDKRSIIGELTEKVSSGFNLVKQADPRGAALPTIESDFAALIP